MFGRKNKSFDFDKEQKKHELKAKQYLNDPQKTNSLLKMAMGKATQNKGSLGEVWGKLQLLFELVRSWAKGDYRNISTSTIVTIIGAIIYFVSPIDMVPDFIAGLGLLDDAAVIGFTLKRVTQELNDFKIWKDTINLTDSSTKTEQPLS